MQQISELALIKQRITKLILSDQNESTHKEFIKFVELFLKIITLEHKLQLYTTADYLPSSEQDQKILTAYLEKFLLSQKNVKS